MLQPNRLCTRPRDEEDQALIRRVAAGDNLAFDTLYQRYTPRLMAYLQPRLGQPELAEEVCQDVLVVVWRKAAQFKPTSRLSSWIFGIAQRLVWKAHARGVTPATQSARPPDEGFARDDLEGDLFRKMSRQRVAQAVAALPPTLRQTITLRYYREFAYREIAVRMGCAEDTVESRLWQARRRLGVAVRRAEHTTPSAM